MSNLNRLNDILFSTLDQVVEKKLDHKDANAVVQVSNSIINNAKLQLAAYKIANKGAIPEMFGLPEGNKKTIPITLPENKPLTSEEKIVMDARDKHATMLKFANGSGFRNTAEAIGEMGSIKFKESYLEWLKN